MKQGIRLAAVPLLTCRRPAEHGPQYLRARSHALGAVPFPTLWFDRSGTFAGFPPTVGAAPDGYRYRVAGRHAGSAPEIRAANRRTRAFTIVTRPAFRRNVGIGASGCRNGHYQPERQEPCPPTHRETSISPTRIAASSRGVDDVDQRDGRRARGLWRSAASAGAPGHSHRRAAAPHDGRPPEESRSASAVKAWNGDDELGPPEHLIPRTGSLARVVPGLGISLRRPSPPLEAPRLLPSRARAPSAEPLPDPPTTSLPRRSPPAREAELATDKSRRASPSPPP